MNTNEPAQYNVDWFRWIAENNPKWLGTQALKLWEHYVALEVKLEAMEQRRAALKRIINEWLECPQDSVPDNLQDAIDAAAQEEGE